MPSTARACWPWSAATHDDGPEQVATLARKIAELRILRDERSVTDCAAPVLVVSQFTLYADTRKGRRPSWSDAAPGAGGRAPRRGRRRRPCGSAGSRWRPGGSGPMMAVELVNDGPFTLVLDI